MPNWNEMLSEVNALGSPFDVMRRKYLKNLQQLTGRNIIVYYSGWLQKPELLSQGFNGFSLDDSDKNGFMTVLNGLDRTLGLDLILQTPGGNIAATESLVEYLRSIFGTDIRVIVPQIAMSAGSMIACSAKEILMGKHSSLGPIDPQYQGLPTHGVIEEFERAVKEVTEDPRTIPIWQPIIAKYNPTLVGECQKAIAWSNQIVKSWLMTGMFVDDEDRENLANRIVSELGDHALTLSHERHISMNKAKDIGLKVISIEGDQTLQDAILSVHHAYILTLTSTPCVKIIENHNGVAFLQQAQVFQQLPFSFPGPQNMQTDPGFLVPQVEPVPIEEHEGE